TKTHLEAVVASDMGVPRHFGGRKLQPYGRYVPTAAPGTDVQVLVSFSGLETRSSVFGRTAHKRVANHTLSPIGEKSPCHSLTRAEGCNRRTRSSNCSGRQSKFSAILGVRTVSCRA